MQWWATQFGKYLISGWGNRGGGTVRGATSATIHRQSRLETPAEIGRKMRFPSQVAGTHAGDSRATKRTLAKLYASAVIKHAGSHR